MSGTAPAQASWYPLANFAGPQRCVLSPILAILPIGARWEERAGALADRRRIFHLERASEGTGCEGRATTKNREFQTCRKQTRKKY